MLQCKDEQEEVIIRNLFKKNYNRPPKNEYEAITKIKHPSPKLYHTMLYLVVTNRKY